MRLEGKIAVVTGAGRGIGRGIALRLAAEGAVVVVADVDAITGGETAELVCRSGGMCFVEQADVSLEQDVDRLMRSTINRVGRLDILVNNAGVDLVAGVEEMGLGQWQRVQAVDLAGAYLCSRYACPFMRESDGGCIVNIASNHAVATEPRRSAYAAAKCGLIGLTRSLALELGPSGIRVNAILPGYIRTEIWRSWLDLAPDPDALVASISAMHPVRRVGSPADVAGVVAFLASDDATFITGASLVVDGGMTCMLPAQPVS